MEGREHVRGPQPAATWLYRIATNVCIDRLRERKRRDLPTLSQPSGTPEDDLVERPARHWLEPIPDAAALPSEMDPERCAALRQSLRLAFVAAVQQLPPRQRAVLPLKDVLDFSAAEIAETLSMTVAAVNSGLQRARASIAHGKATSPAAELSPTQRELIERYVDAFHAYDVEALVGLLRDDATMCMPPYTLWLEGPRTIGAWFLGRGIGCRGSRLVPTAACGSVAFGQYRRSGKDYRAWSLVVLDLVEDRIASMTHFLEVEALFPRFGLALEFEVDGSPQAEEES